VLVQIYGITTLEDAVDVDRLGPDTIGVVLDEGLGTWDSVDAGMARRIAAAVTRAGVVALSLSVDPAVILATLRTVGPDILHLARAHEMSDAALEEVRRSVRGVQLMLTVPVDGAGSVSVARRLAETADYLLLDTKHPESGIVGATGETHDWALSAEIVRATELPTVLAGGLGPHNVRDAIEQVGPFGVDSETRTSQDAERRRKDMAKVEQFIALARAD
jgi:phosphoribosylanthranilate isomerase